MASYVYRVTRPLVVSVLLLSSPSAPYVYVKLPWVKSRACAQAPTGEMCPRDRGQLALMPIAPTGERAAALAVATHPPAPAAEMTNAVRRHEVCCRHIPGVRIGRPP